MKGKRYKTIKIQFEYWKPGTNIVDRIVKILKGKVKDGDVVVLSEKALSVALGYVADESLIKPTVLSKFFTFFWMRLVWGYLLGHLCKLKTSTIRWLRTYPINNGAAHKQLTLKVTGLAQTLKPFSEGGIDASNLPHNFVSLPIMNLQEKTDCLRKKLENDLNIKLTLMVVDSDRLYISKNKKIPLKLSTRKTCCKTVLSLGFLAYLVGRIFRKRFKPTATPLAISGRNFSDEEVLTIAEIADRVRGYGSGRTVFEMAEYFKAPVDRVTWEMLEKIRHYPVVVVRTQN